MLGPHSVDMNSVLLIPPQTAAKLSLRPDAAMLLNYKNTEDQGDRELRAVRTYHAEVLVERVRCQQLCETQFARVFIKRPFDHIC